MPATAADRMLEHYVDNARALPWRARPGEPAPDPYRVWLSEIMLQQTTVAAVSPRFERFLARWPTVEALAAASDEDILSEWAGLGYYARARNLIACAREVALRGGFPETEAGLRELPGLGDYTAAAIAAIAFGATAAAVDTNVERVIARLFALAEPSRAEVRDRFLALTEGRHSGDSIQAMMDLGAAICRPRAPRCGDCPLRPDCVAFASGTPESFPSPKAKRVRPRRFGTAWWIEQDGAVWLVRRPASGLLGGMAALPGSDFTEQPATANAPGEIGRVRHVFTHFALDLTVATARNPPPGEGWWHPLENLGQAGLPTLYRRAAELALASPGRRRAA